METIFTILVLLGLFFVLGLAYKKRRAIGRWLEDPEIEISADSEYQRMLYEFRMAVLKRKLELLKKE